MKTNISLLTEMLTQNTWGGNTAVSHVFILRQSSNLTARGERSTIRSWFRMSCLPVKPDWVFHLSIMCNWNELWQVRDFV